MEIKGSIQLHFLNITPAQNDNLIALLADIGYSGFEEEENSLKAFIDEKSFNSDELDVVLKIIPAEYSRSVIKEQNWNAVWESSFEPIIVKDFAAIRAGFHNSIKNVKHEIIITPKMSFGTGHHATTYMMIEEMEGLDLINKTVVDFGTGTGVLAILAEKMGASNIDAIDNDDWSIENATENIATNNCTKIKLHKAETVFHNRVYDIILANINLNVIQANLDGIAAACKKGTMILLSGFLKTDEQILVKQLSLKNITHLQALQKGEWICLLARMD
jgi:ribosomal protein L11 methyltransferase